MQVCSPLPEALDGNKWDVRKGDGQCNTLDRIMLVPMGPSAGDRHVRNHEMVHGKITPKVYAHKQCKKFGITMMAVQVCEDLRVHRYMRQLRLDCPGVLDQQEMDSMVERRKESQRELAALLVATIGTDDHEKAIASMQASLEPGQLKNLTEGASLIYRRMNGARNLFRPIGFRNATVPGARLFDTLWPETAGEGGDGKIPMAALGGKECSGGRSGKWGTMNVTSLPASVTRSIAAISRQKIYTNEGAALVAPYRLPVDGRVFCRKKPARGGTVLIDGSGSMSLSQAELQRIVTTAPAATIAVYSGRDKSGTLTIIGRKGRIADQNGISIAHLSGSGNVIDGPALDWLSKQQGPRLWISDGMVTGQYDRPSLDLAADAARICHRGGIKRVEKADAVVDLLKAARRR